MKRSWFGLGLLVVLLVLGVLTTQLLTTIHEPGAQALAEASELAAQGRWEEAEALAWEARDSWESRRGLVAALLDHEPIEELSAQLAKLDAYRDARDVMAFRAQCLYLAHCMEALGEGQRLILWNLL